MRVSIFAYSDKGCVLSLKIASFFENSSCYAIEKFAKKYNLTSVKSTKAKVAEVFSQSDLIIFVGACGIAVRSIAPVISSKTNDPACVVIDDNGNFAIPILSGHIGGANEFSAFLAKKLGATAVITTATDINSKFSCDTFAKNNDLKILSMDKAKEFSAQILTMDLPVSFGDAIKLKTNLPNGIFKQDFGDFGAYIGYEKINPYTKTLKLVPKILNVGIGCKKDTPCYKIEKLFLKVLSDNLIEKSAVKSINSIDLKKNERGLIEFCQKYEYPVNFYSSNELLAQAGEFSASEFVKTITGVDNVCERSAIKGSENGTILIKKTCLDGVTVAIAVEEKEIYFE